MPLSCWPFEKSAFRTPTDVSIVTPRAHADDAPAATGLSRRHFHPKSFKHNLCPPPLFQGLPFMSASSHIIRVDSTTVVTL
jgi:hypothetical protein